MVPGGLATTAPRSCGPRPPVQCQKSLVDPLAPPRHHARRRSQAQDHAAGPALPQPEPGAALLDALQRVRAVPQEQRRRRGRVQEVLPVRRLALPQLLALPTCINEDAECLDLRDIGSLPSRAGSNDHSASWSGSYARVHAGGHAGGHQGADHPADAGEACGLPDLPGQHVPLGAASWHGGVGATAWQVARVHAVAAQPADRLRGLPDGESLEALRGVGARRAVRELRGRIHHGPDARGLHRPPEPHWRGHHHGAGRRGLQPRGRRRTVQRGLRSHGAVARSLHPSARQSGQAELVRYRPGRTRCE
ncbi:hypothetical protein ON010_g11984 [Phytophthora cinnamomi]|nr:hypothetical protein ON010_g11984 [Phytophthora cinnamomi]